MGICTINFTEKWKNIFLGGHPTDFTKACDYVNGNIVAGSFGVIRQILIAETFLTANTFKTSTVSDPAWYSDGVISRYYDGTNFIGNNVNC